MQAAIAALAAESERLIAQADAAMDDYFRAAWPATMTDVADEMQAEMANLPPATHRRPTHQRDRQRPDLPRTAWSMIILGERRQGVNHAIKSFTASKRPPQ